MALIRSLARLFVLTPTLAVLPVFSQVTTYTNRVDPPIEGAKDMAARLKIAEVLVDNTTVWRSNINFLASKVPGCLWAPPFAGRVSEKLREMAIERVQHVPAETLWPVILKLPSFPALKADMTKNLASQNTVATLTRATELLRDPTASQFVVNWLGAQNRLFAFGCGMPLVQVDAILEREFMMWSITP